MSPDGSYLIFVSNRPVFAGGAPIDGLVRGKPQPGKGGNLWKVDRVKGGWSRPARLSIVINDGGSIYAPSISADGTLFFMKPSLASGRFQLFVAKSLAQGYDEPRALPFSDGSTTDVDPAVAPDQSFLIFGSGRRANTDIDLYISRREGGGWGTPVNLGTPLNGPTSDAEPRLGPGGRTLYFSSERLASVPDGNVPGDALEPAENSANWNNGLYNIWSADLQPMLTMPPVMSSPTVAAEAETADEAGVRAFEQRWSQAYLAGDVSDLDALLHDDYVSVTDKSEVRTKQEVIAAASRYAARHPGERATPLAADVVIKLYGCSAIVRHTSARGQSVDMLHYDAGRWSAIHSHHSASSMQAR